MKRRQFITGTAASLLTACQDYRSWLDVPPWLPINVLKPAMQQGHYLRQLKQLPPAQGERRVDTLIIGSGVAGLTAAWRLQQQGYHNFLLLMGGETFGNANAGQWQDVAYPRGAHYLPLPTLESTHIREMLAAWQIIEKDAFSLRPTYDELSLVHAPDERILINQQWHDGLLAHNDKNSQSQQQRFFRLMNDYQQQRGNDGKPVFTIPIASCSMDETWRALDKLNFSQWLTQQGFNDAALRWYLDYACKDDYGLDSQQISAWAGIHYFASRHGLAANASDNTVLTWPDGLHHLAAKMLPNPQQLVDGFALNIQEQKDSVNVLYLDTTSNKIFNIKAQQVICATPLHVTKHLLPQLNSDGIDWQQDMPVHAPWLVSNFYLDKFPQELKGNSLAWDNVIYGSPHLGYVVATHQWLRAAKPQYTVFTAYHAFNSPSTATRQWLSTATTSKLLEIGIADLKTAYGRQLWTSVKGVELCVRGHAMAAPIVGFLSNKSRHYLQQADGRLLFAHSDLSGYSIFEEAAWWGWQAANKILR